MPHSSFRAGARPDDDEDDDASARGAARADRRRFEGKDNNREPPAPLQPWRKF
jgi:hypothetical protein